MGDPYIICLRSPHPCPLPTRGRERPGRGNRRHRLAHDRIGTALTLRHHRPAEGVITDGGHGARQLLNVRQATGLTYAAPASISCRCSTPAGINCTAARVSSPAAPAPSCRQVQIDPLLDLIAQGACRWFLRRAGDLPGADPCPAFAAPTWPACATGLRRRPPARKPVPRIPGQRASSCAPAWA